MRPIEKHLFTKNSNKYFKKLRHPIAIVLSPL